jgi:hypothetical protein
MILEPHLSWRCALSVELQGLENSFQQSVVYYELFNLLILSFEWGLNLIAHSSPLVASPCKLDNMLLQTAACTLRAGF